MSDGQDKVFFQCDTGEWALGTEKQFAESAATTGTRIKLVVAPMTYGEFCRRMPNLAARMSDDCTFVRGAPGHACQTKNFRFVEVGGLRVAVADHGADKKCAEDFDISIGPLSATMTPDQIAEAVMGTKRSDGDAFDESMRRDRVAGINPPRFYSSTDIEPGAVREPKKTTINLDVGPSPEEFAAKCEKLAEPAQRAADAANGVFRSTVSIPASQPVGDFVSFCADGAFSAHRPQDDAPQWLDRETLSGRLGISRSTFYRKVAEGQIEVAAVAGRRVYRPCIDVYRKEDVDIEVSPPDAHQLQTELADLRAKLRYVTACAPAGFRLVEGHVSSVKGRETPGHVNRMAYVNGVRAEHVTDALPGPHGFVIRAPGNVAQSGVVHVIERERLPDGEWGPSWPAALTFSVIA